MARDHLQSEIICKNGSKGAAGRLPSRLTTGARNRQTSLLGQRSYPSSPWSPPPPFRPDLEPDRHLREPRRSGSRFIGRFQVDRTHPRFKTALGYRENPNVCGAFPSPFERRLTDAVCCSHFFVVQLICCICATASAVLAWWGRSQEESRFSAINNPLTCWS
jgi:hypothetical protein